MLHARPDAVSVVALVLVLAVGCAPSGSSGGSNSGGGQTGLEISFETTALTVTEIEGTFNLKLVLSMPAPEDIELPFTVEGNAQQFLDYTMVTGSPFSISAGLTEAFLPIQVHEDIFGELDEVVFVTLQPPSNASLGTPRQLEFTILDEDHASFQESEPNDHYSEANEVGSMAEHFAYVISGDAHPGPLDVFRFGSINDAQVHIELDPQSQNTFAWLQVQDANGNPIVTYDDGLAGTTITGDFDMPQGATFHLAVAGHNVGSGYTLRVVGTLDD